MPQLFGPSSCPGCGKPIVDRFAKSCDHWRCRQQTAKIRREKSFEAVANKLKRLEANVEAAKILLNQQPSQSSYQVLVTPANELELVALPRSRKQRFAKRLIETVESAFREQPVIEANRRGDWQESGEGAADFSLPIFGQVCGNCRGKCCTRGGTSAYISVQTINRYRAQNSVASPREIVRDYCTKVPDQTYRGSCVFHSESGCGLPQAMRSNTCNNTVCGGLVEMNQRIELDSQDKFFVAACDASGVRRTMSVDASADIN